jgi:hypothetical protein
MVYSSVNITITSPLIHCRKDVRLRTTFAATDSGGIEGSEKTLGKYTKHGDFRGFNMFLMLIFMEFHGDFIELNGDVMAIQWDFMGFNDNVISWDKTKQF